MANLTSTLTVKLIDDVSKPARSVAQALKDAESRAKDVAKAMSGVGATDKLTKSLSSLKLAAKDVEQVASAWKDYAKASNLASDSSKWTKTQANDVRAWERQTVSSLRQVKREQEQFYRSQAAAQKSAQEQAARRPAGGMRMNWGVAAGAAGVAATYKAGQFASQGIHNYREYSDVNAIMRPILDLTPAEQASLKKQQMQLGVESRYSPVKIAEAQKLLGERGVDKRFIESYVRQAVNYASAMNVDMPEAVKTLEANIFSTGKLKGVTDTGSAEKIMRHVTDFSTHLAKISGLNNEEISDFYEYGGLSAKQAGLSDETAGAMAAIMKRNQVSGSKSGVAMRAIAAKLVSPSDKGMGAFRALGIDYNKFTKMPGGLSGENLAMAVKGSLFQKLSADQIARLNALSGATYADDKGEQAPVVGSREEYTHQAGEIIAESFGNRKKDGSLHANDAKHIASLVKNFHKMSVESVDSEGLVKALANSGATLAQLNALFGFQQGSRAGAALMNPQELDANRKKLSETPEGYAENIAAERLKSFDGAVKNAEGSLEALQIRVASMFDNDGKGGGALTGMVNAFTKVTNAVIGLPDPLLALATAAAAAGTAFVGLKSIGALTTGFGLTGAATELSGAALALDAAAAKLGGGALAGDLAGGLAGGGKRGLGLLAGGAAAVPWLLGGAAAIAGGVYLIGQIDPHAPVSGRGYSKRAGRFDDVHDGDAHSLRGFSGDAGHWSNGRGYQRTWVPDAPRPVEKEWSPGAVGGWGARAGAGAGQIDELKAKADEAKPSLLALNAPVAPQVDASGLDALIAKANQASAALSSLRSNVAKASAGLAASLGASQRGHFGSPAVQGE